MSSGVPLEICLESYWSVSSCSEWMLGFSNSLPALQSTAGDCSGSGSLSQCGRTGWRLQGGNQSPRQPPLKPSSQRVARIAKHRNAPPRGKPENPGPAEKRRAQGREEEMGSGKYHLKYFRLSSPLKEEAVWVLITRRCLCAHSERARGCA